jgi:hypothetical protein
VLASLIATPRLDTKVNLGVAYIETYVNLGVATKDFVIQCRYSKIYLLTLLASL